MELLKQLFVATGSSLLMALIIWLVSRHRPIAEWINNHLIGSALIGLVVIYIAGLLTTTYIVLSARQEMADKISSLHQEISVWSNKPWSTQNGDMNCPPNMYVTSVSLPVINNGGFVGVGSVTCRSLNVAP